MINDPQIKKDVWDARVKIVIGRFIITTFQVFMVYAILILVIDHFVMGDSGDAFIAPMITRYGIPLAVIVLVVGYFVSYVPKKKQIDLFTTHLLNHKQNFDALPKTSEVIRTVCFVGDFDLKVYANFNYYHWQDSENLYFFPVKPTIELLDDYISQNISYSVSILPISSILSFNPSEKITKTEKGYDQKKKLISIINTYDTMKLSYQNQKIVTLQFDSIMLQALDKVASSKKLTEKKTPLEKTVPTSVPLQEDFMVKIEKLKKMLDANLITEAEFQEQKKKILDKI
ncbi:MAG: SHOCT domain-containing protein [Firmicutes bacterium]|nr:SHOCT domain-containing protein [Bacillota bacterium]